MTRIKCSIFFIFLLFSIFTFAQERSKSQQPKPPSPPLPTAIQNEIKKVIDHYFLLQNIYNRLIFQIESNQDLYTFKNLSTLGYPSLSKIFADEALESFLEYLESPFIYPTTSVFLYYQTHMIKSIETPDPKESFKKQVSVFTIRETICPLNFCFNINEEEKIVQFIKENKLLYTLEDFQKINRNQGVENFDIRYTVYQNIYFSMEKRTGLWKITQIKKNILRSDIQAVKNISDQQLEMIKKIKKKQEQIQSNHQDGIAPLHNEEIPTEPTIILYSEDKPQQKSETQLPSNELISQKNNVKITQTKEK